MSDQQPEPKGTYTYDLRRVPWYLQKRHIEDNLRNVLDANGHRASLRFVFTVLPQAFDQLLCDSGIANLATFAVFARIEGYFQIRYSGDCWEMTVTVRLGAPLPAKRERGGQGAD